MTASGLVKNLNQVLLLKQNQCGMLCNVTRCWKWDITKLVAASNTLKYAVLILNRPISLSNEFMKNFWNNAAVRLTVDGGTVQWDKFVGKLPVDVQKSMKLPDLITGDFDSITDEMMKKYTNQSCEVVHTPDQDYTDFTKALLELNKYCDRHKVEVQHIVAVGQSSGRLDQIIGNIQSLFLVKEQALIKPDVNAYLLMDDSVSWLLSPGDHIIKIPEESRRNKRAWCSLIPIGEACQRVVTSGLKWNLDNQPLKFGELVSTSNTFDGSEYVKVKCSNTLLWSLRVPSLIDP